MDANILERNKRNAQHSTGPKSAGGKAIVAQNARRHGATAAANPAEIETWLRVILDTPAALGLPDAELIAPATLIGIAEMYIPALLVREAATPARFFIAVLSISQLIFFSAVAPMMIDMFQKIPIRARELVAIFLMRTAVLIPVLAIVTALLDRAGVLS